MNYIKKGIVSTNEMHPTISKNDLIFINRIYKLKNLQDKIISIKFIFNIYY